MSDERQNEEKTADEIIESTMQGFYDKPDEDEEKKEKPSESADTDTHGYDDDLDDDDDDYGDDDDDDEDFLEPPQKKRNWRKILGITFGSIIGVILIVYVGFSIYFQNHFLFFTKINGVDFSMRNVEQVEEYMDQQVADYVLTLTESDGSTEEIKGSDISAKYVPGDELNEIMEEQQAFAWPAALFDHPNIDTPVGVSYDEDQLNEQIKSLKCTDEDNWVISENAIPVFLDSEFVIQPEVIGTELDMDKFDEAVETAINGFQSDLDLQEEGCYIMPKYTEDSEKVIKAADKANGYLGAKITYDMDPDTVVVDSSVISGWVKISKKNEKVSFDEDEVKQFISNLADQYDTAGKTREFTTAKGDKVKVEGGDYGWKIDQSAEYDQLTKDIKSGDTIEREPEYSRTAVSHGENELGDTYAEVDLSGQHMYYTKDGEVVLDSDVVTGNPNNGNATPQGTYSITYTEKDAVLRGPRQADGSYEYETPVTYWMPFNGGIGFHDATWQSSFGGDRYLSHGSHGCVNMPKDKAAELFSMITKGTPVVCYN